MLALLAQATDNLPDVSNSVNNTNATGIIAGLGIFLLVIVIIGLVLWLFNLWMAIDCAVRKDTDFPGNNKTLWLVLLFVGLFVGFGWIVALVYYFSVKKKAGQGGGGAAPSQPANTDTPAQE